MLHADMYFGRGQQFEQWHKPLVFQPYINPEGLRDGSYVGYENGPSERGLIHILRDRYQARWRLDGNDICFTRVIHGSNPNGINPLSVRFSGLSDGEIIDDSMNVLVVCDPQEARYQNAFYISSPQDDRIVYTIQLVNNDFLIQSHTYPVNKVVNHTTGEILRIYRTEQEQPFIVVHTLNEQKDIITRFPTTLLQAHGQVVMYDLFDTMIRNYTGALRGRAQKTALDLRTDLEKLVNTAGISLHQVNRN